MAIKSIKSFFQILFIAVFLFGIFSEVNGQYQQNSSSSTKNVDFLADWSTNSYSPLDYEGKTIPGYGSIVTLSVTPLSYINENDYSYTWIIDSGFTPNNNGNPVSTFTVRKNTGGEHIAFLTIRNKKDNSVIKETTLSVPIISPNVIVYKELISGSLYPLIVPLNLGNSIKSGSKLNLVAKPFSFNKIKDGRLLKYTWELNGKKVDTSESKSNLSIDFPREISIGSLYDLKLAVENPFDAFQFDEKSYKITVR